VLTFGGDRRETPDFEEGQWQCWRPAAVFMHGGALVLSWRRGAAGKVRPDVLELSVAKACPDGYLVRRNGAAEPGSYGGGGILQRGGVRQGGARRG
jgi:hypothetical protein